jgi:uncharacterized protein
MKIGIDIDEVLCDFVGALLERYNERNKTAFTKTQMHTYRLEDLYGCSTEEAWIHMNEILTSHDLHAKVPLIDGATRAIAQLKNEHTLWLVSARPEYTRDVTEAWIQHHFPDMFEDTYLIGTEGSGGARCRKSDVVEELDLEFFIEDSLPNALDITEKGVPVILIDRPWNQGHVPSGVTRVYTWDEVLEHVGNVVCV